MTEFTGHGLQALWSNLLRSSLNVLRTHGMLLPAEHQWPTGQLLSTTLDVVSFSWVSLTSERVTLIPSRARDSSSSATDRIREPKE